MSYDSIQAETDTNLVTTFFAPATRATDQELEQAIAAATNNPIIDAALETFGGLLVVLNEHRQVISINASLLRYLDVDDPMDVMGLRPGEVLECIHAKDNSEGGCGTGPACSTCGAAIAIVDCLATQEPQAQECVINATRGQETVDLTFKLRVTTATIKEAKLLFVFLEDISEAKRRQTLERAFFHDVNNIVQALCGVSELLALGDPQRRVDMVRRVGSLAERLSEEVAIQRVLALSKPTTYPLNKAETTVATLLVELERTLSSHPAARDRIVKIDEIATDHSFSTDTSLTLRVLTNMGVNALEATQPGSTVRVSSTFDDQEVRFQVWNSGAMPANVALRVFERHFTTKLGIGRGTGTFAMKLFGERFLGGQVGFTSTADDGTAFWLRLPV